MKHYNRFSKLDFGFYNDYELGLVFVFDAAYIDWCINNIDWFHVSDINELMDIGLMTDSDSWEFRMNGIEAKSMGGINIFSSLNGMFNEIGHDYSQIKYKFSPETIEKNESKSATPHSFTSNDYNNDDNDNDADDDDYNNDYSTYDGYNGWSDDAIDEAFDGDPESSWNVD